MMATCEQRLHAELVAALHERTGLLPALAAPFASAILAHLQDRYATEPLYIPAAKRVYPIAALRRALLSGESYRTVAKRYDMGHATLRRLLPRKSLGAATGGDS